MFGGPLREIENEQVAYMHIYMLLILHPFQPPVFPNYPFPDTNSPISDKVYYVQSGTWAYRGLGSIGGFVIGEFLSGKM